jgi:hypothetical protein
LQSVKRPLALSNIFPTAALPNVEPIVEEMPNLSNRETQRDAPLVAEAISIIEHFPTAALPNVEPIVEELPNLSNRETQRDAPLVAEAMSLVPVNVLSDSNRASIIKAEVLITLQNSHILNLCEWPLMHLPQRVSLLVCDKK